MVRKNVVLLKKNKPEKCHDLGMFTLPCVIGEEKKWHAMLDLGKKMACYA